jgi:hypothetical protein
MHRQYLTCVRGAQLFLLSHSFGNPANMISNQK